MVALKSLYHSFFLDATKKADRRDFYKNMRLYYSRKKTEDIRPKERVFRFYCFYDI